MRVRQGRFGKQTLASLKMLPLDDIQSRSPSKQPGRSFKFFADCSRIVEKVKLGVRSSRSGSRNRSRFVPAGALNTLPFHILWLFISYIFKPSLKVDVRAQNDFFFFAECTDLRECVFLLVMHLSFGLSVLLHCNKDNRRSWKCCCCEDIPILKAEYVCCAAGGFFTGRETLISWAFFLFIFFFLVGVWPEAAGRNLSVASCPVGVGLRWRPLPASSPGGRYHLSSGPGWRGGEGRSGLRRWQWRRTSPLKWQCDCVRSLFLPPSLLGVHVKPGGLGSPLPFKSSPLRPWLVIESWEIWRGVSPLCVKLTPAIEKPAKD